MNYTISFALTGLILVSCQNHTKQPIATDNPSLPVAWTTYQKYKSYDDDFRDIRNHNVGLIEFFSDTLMNDAEEILQLCRKHHLKLAVPLGSHLLPNAEMVTEAGMTPEPAIMIGGVYMGKAIDRHLFAFTAARHRIIIEPPVYNQNFAYTIKDGSTTGHYYPGIAKPLRAEIIVPLKQFDGRQHLAIIPCTIEPINGDTVLKNESVPAGSYNHPEIKSRTLYALRFDLTGYDTAMLDKIAIAAYWNFFASDKWYMFNSTPVSAASQVTADALRKKVQQTIERWSRVNHGSFPSNDIVAMRFGDECFYITGHLTPSSPSVNFPLWDYSHSAIEDFKIHCPGTEYPRTWGFPEIYGIAAYSVWMYRLHANTARLASIVKDECNKRAPQLLIYRNTTRANVFSIWNDHDGTGNELLVRELDFANIDPYPVINGNYTNLIPMDMSYYAGLARRYNKLLIPWLQAHMYGSSLTTHVKPADIRRMVDEHLAHGIDALLWLGYGKHSFTFPAGDTSAWNEAAKQHQQLSNKHILKPQANLAAIRSYDAWALNSIADGKITHTDDWMLQQFLYVWSVTLHQHYDVFEVKPQLAQPASDSLMIQLKKYKYIVSNIDIPGAWNISSEFSCNTVIPEDEQTYRVKIKELIRQKKLLD